MLCPCPGLCSAEAHTICFCRNAHQIFLPFLAEGIVNQNQILPFFRLSPALSSLIQGCVCGSSQVSCLLASLFCSHLPTFRCLNEWISQACLCVEQELLCWVIIIEIVETLRERPRKSALWCPKLSLGGIVTRKGWWGSDTEDILLFHRSPCLLMSESFCFQFYCELF